VGRAALTTDANARTAETPEAILENIVTVLVVVEIKRQTIIRRVRERRPDVGEVKSKGSRQNERCQCVEESETTKDGEDKKEDRRYRDTEEESKVEREAFLSLSSRPRQCTTPPTKLSAGREGRKLLAVVDLRFEESAPPPAAAAGVPRL